VGWRYLREHKAASVERFPRRLPRSSNLLHFVAPALSVFVNPTPHPTLFPRADAAGTFVLTDVSLTRADASTLSTPATLRAGASLTSDAGTLNLGNAHITAPAAGAPAGSVTVDTALHVAGNVALDGTTVSINGYTVGECTWSRVVSHIRVFGRIAHVSQPRGHWLEQALARSQRSAWSLTPPLATLYVRTLAGGGAFRPSASQESPAFTDRPCGSPPTLSSSSSVSCSLLNPDRTLPRLAR